jgi:hypothetical protein
MASPPPLWKQLFDAVDQRIGPSVNELAQSDQMAIAAALAVRGRRELEQRVERVSRRLLHALNLPAGSDVNRLLDHIAQLEREVRDLREQLSDRENVEFLAQLQLLHDAESWAPSKSSKSSKASRAKGNSTGRQAG